MGKGKDKDSKRGGPKQYAEVSDQVETRKPKKKGKAAFEESSDEEEEEELVPVQQNANAGMMPPSDDSEEEETDDEEEEEKGPVATAAEMAAFIKSKGLEGELKAWLKARAASAKKGKPMPGYELSKAEAAKKKAEEEESSEEEIDPKVQQRLEEVKKRREKQRQDRIAADGWDRMMPMTADNHPPGMQWPPPDQKE